MKTRSDSGISNVVGGEGGVNVSQLVDTDKDKECIPK